jgi:hypothetical protein
MQRVPFIDIETQDPERSFPGIHFRECGNIKRNEKAQVYHGEGRGHGKESFVSKPNKTDRNQGQGQKILDPEMGEKFKWFP